MHTFLIQNDNSVIATKRQRIIQCSRLADNTTDGMVYVNAFDDEEGDG
ncbi:hypothetical protein [Clostridium sp. AF22-10]